MTSATMPATPTPSRAQRAWKQSLLGHVRERRRQIAGQRTRKFTRWAKDPVGFVQNVLLGFLWSKQREICESVRDHRFTSVMSCHDVGKSAVAARIAAWWISVHPPGEAFVVTSAPTFNQVKGILWREINKVHRLGGLPGRCNSTQWIMPPNELVGFGRAVRDTDPTALQGIHARYVLVIFDEACGMAPALWDAASSLVANDDSRFLAIGNPDDPSSEFKRSCQPGSGFNVIRINALESPNFTGEPVPDFLKHVLVGPTWVAERKRKWGEASPLYISKVLGLFPDQASDGLLSGADISAACAREYKPKRGDANELGVDVARFGDDASCIYHRHGWRARCIAKLHKRDTMTLTGEVVKAIRATGATAVKIDDTGVGGGVTDRLNELRAEGRLPATLKIVPVIVGTTFSRDEVDGERFWNIRAKINWIVRDLFVDGLIDIDKDDDDLQAEAVEIKYKPNSAGIILIEEKKDMKKRLHGRSPDHWDALVLAFTPAELGGKMAIEAQEPEFLIPHFDIPKHWLRSAALVIDRGRIAAVWGAYDQEGKVAYLYGEYSAPRGDMALHADAIRRRGGWIPILFHPEGEGRKKTEGQKLVDRLVDLQVNLFVTEGEEHEGLASVSTMLDTKRLRVFSSMGEWRKQFKGYRRNSDGEVIEGDFQLMRATELFAAEGTGIAAPDADLVREATDGIDDESRDSTTGY